MKIINTFQIAGRGLVVSVDQVTELPVAKKLVAKITRPDGAILSSQAFKEFILQRNPSSVEREAFLLLDLSKADVPIGSEIELEVLPASGTD